MSAGSTSDTAPDRDRLRSRRLDLADLTVLRYVPGDSFLHRRSPTVKVLAQVAVVVGLAVSASWPAVGLLGGLAVLGVLLARLPAGVAPRPPRLLWVGIGLMIVVSTVAGGEPSISVGDAEVEVGGFLIALRLLAFTAVVLTTAGLVGWTTPAADLTPAIARILGPLRLLRVPVDELVAALALSVRALPLLLDELKTLAAVWRTRPGRSSASWADVGATVVTNAVRRAGELGDAIHARGGVSAPARPDRVGPVDLLFLLVVAIAVAAAVTLT